MRATNRKTLSQIDRVLAVAQSYAGVCQADFLGPQVCDNGPPITRLAARIQDAEDRGYRFEIIGWRSKTKVYRLIAEPELHGTPLPREGKGAQPPEIPSPSPRLRSEPAAGTLTLFEVPSAQPHWKAA